MPDENPTRGGNARMFFTSESVTEGHPDKLADRISDSVLDAILREDKNARVACETLVTTGLVVVAGEITCDCYVDMRAVIRRAIREVGYTRAKFGFDGDNCAVMVCLDEQSPDIAMGVDQALESRTGGLPAALGAGDQGMMFGFACDENDQMMPTPIYLAHRLAQQLAQVRKKRNIPYLRPDGKTQVTVEYVDDRPVRVDKIVVSCQHREDASQEKIRKDILQHVIEPVISPRMRDKKTQVFVNPTGRFVVGGPAGDAGLTGRKIIVDTYGGFARHGGGAFSGKDPTKVDRSASYAARYVAKNVVAAGLASRCEVQLSYAIGVAKPLSINVYTGGTAKIAEERIAQLIEQHFDLTPGGIINHFDLRRPIYTPFSSYGHFGRTDVEAPWERTDKAEVLRIAAKKHLKEKKTA